MESQANRLTAIGAEVDIVIGPVLLRLRGIEAAVGLGIEGGGELRS